MSQENNKKEELLENKEALPEENTPSSEQSAPSIFDKPDHNYKPAKKKMPMWLMATVSIVVCAAIVVSAVYIPKLLKDDEVLSSSTVSQAEVTITLCDYSKYNDTLKEVAEYGKGGIDNILYRVDGYDFKLVQGEYDEVTTDAEGNETKTKKVGWTVGNYEGIRWSEDNVAGLVQNALKVTAIVKLEENAKDLSIYGLEEGKEFSSLTVSFKDKTDYKVLVGAYSADNTGRYIRFEGENTVYLSSYSFANYSSLSAKQMPALNSLGKYETTGKDSDYLNNGQLLYFDAIFMFGKNMPHVISFAPADMSTTYTYYSMVTPVEMAADDDKVQEILQTLSAGISASEVLEFLPDEKTAASYGLHPKTDDNYMKLVFMVAGVTHQFTIGNPLEDGSFPVMINEANVIYKVSPSNFAYIKNEYTDFLRANLFLASITAMESFSIKGEGIDETFYITNIAVEAENNVYNQTVKLKNGKSVDDAVFKEALSTFQRLAATDYDHENLGKTDKKPVLTVKINYSDKKRKESVITFYEFSSRRYLYKIDSQGNALISIGDFEAVLKTAKEAQKALI